MNFYIPVEVKDRELYAKILVAKYAAENGFNVILGKKNDVNRLVLNMPRGVYYGLGIAKNYNDFFEKLSKLGHIIVVGEVLEFEQSDTDALVFFKGKIDTVTNPHVI